MTSEESKKMSAYAGELFGDLKGEQLKYLVEQIKPFDKIGVQTALKTHRANHEFFSFPQFFEGVRAEQARSEARRHRSKQLTVAEWLSTQIRFQNDPPATAIQQHYAEAWATADTNPTAAEHGKQSIRKLILGHAKSALEAIGWLERDAIEAARGCVGLSDGEHITVPRAEGPMAESVSELIQKREVA